MPIPPDHQMVSAADAGPGAPFTSTECPSDDAEAAASDIRRVAANMHANFAYYAVETPDNHTFDDGLVVNTSTTNRTAIVAEANGTGRGIEATGGASSGSGGLFQGGATNGHGIESTGAGTGSGAVLQGGAAGVGLEVSAGGGNTNGIEAYATGAGYALSCEAGGIQFNGAQPDPTDDPGANAAHATNQVKAFAHITTTGAGSASGDIALVDGYNIASVAFAVGNGVIITFARPFANANYSVQVTNGDGTAKHGVWDFSLSSASACRVKLFSGTTLQPPESTALRFTVTISGRQ